MFLKVWASRVAGNLLFGYVWDLVADLIVSRIVEYSTKVDFEKVLKDCKVIIRNRVPTKFLQDICISILVTILDNVKGVVDGKLEEFLEEQLTAANIKRLVKSIKKSVLDRLRG